jgi:hypothetical protein
MLEEEEMVVELRQLGEPRRVAALLPTLIAAVDHGRAYVQKGASWALRQVGKRSDDLS